MANTYWLSFELDSDRTYQKRYKALVDAIAALVSGFWWFETTSFYIFSSDASIDQVAASVKAAISPTSDRAVVGMPDYKSARAIGNIDDLATLKSLIPFIKKV